MTADASTQVKLQNPTTEINKASTISEQAVIEFLTHNPHFLIQHPTLLSQLEVSNQQQEGQPVSLVQRQVIALRDEKTKLNNKLQQLIDTAKTNETLYTKTRHLITDILQQDNIDALLSLLTSKLSDYYSVDSSNVILLDQRFEQLAPLHMRDLEEAKEAIASLLQNKKVVCGSLREHESNFLFKDAHAVQSVAVAPLYHEESLLGIFALGSHDADHFKAGSETTLIDFLCKVICLSLSRTLK